MRNILLFVSFLFSLPAVLSAQNLNFVLSTGIGSYRMNDLKEINNITLESLPFEAKITDNFPDYFNYKSSLQYSFKKLLALGITCSFQSTGSRISRADYSGEYYFDSRIRAFSPGLITEFYFPVSKFTISLNNEVGMEFSKLRLKEFIRINTDSEADRYTFTSKSWYYEPTFSLTYPILFFRAGLAAGYLFDIKRGTFLSPDLNSNSITLSDGKPAVPDWSGIRVRISLSFNVLQIFKSDSHNPPLNKI